MKKRSYSFLIISIVVLFSCSQKSEDMRAQAAKDEIPAALETNKSYDEISIGKRSYEDLLEQLYKEEVDKNPDLQKLEKSLEDYPDSLRKTNEVFSDYDSKSKNYYSAASSKLSSIKDSLLRKKMEALLEKSQSNYDIKTSAHNRLLATMSGKDAEIADQYTAVKVLVTLSIIEKYQTSQLPDKRIFEKQIREQNELLKSIQQVK